MKDEFAMKASNGMLASTNNNAQETHRVYLKGIKFVLNRTLGLAIVLAVWVLITEMGWVNVSLLPEPLTVLETMFRMLTNGTLIEHTLASLTRVAWGFLFALIIALPLGLLVGISSGMKNALDPIIELLRPIPPIAIIPLAILWFGIGEGSKIFIIAYAAFFPLVLNIMGGIQNVEHVHIKAAQTLGVNKFQMFYLVTLRSAVPYIVIGMRAGVSMAFISLVAAELIASSKGLGFIIQDARYLFRTDEMLVGMITIGIIGFLINRLLVELERGLVRWR